jgi:hypothetical protein
LKTAQGPIKPAGSRLIPRRSYGLIFANAERVVRFRNRTSKFSKFLKRILSPISDDIPVILNNN